MQGQYIHTCQWCGVTFGVPGWRHRRGEIKFCSRSCLARSKRGARGTNWKGGRSFSGTYMRVRIAGQGYVYEHRAVASEAIGRPLTNADSVHHLNGCKTDNRPENLAVLAPGEHSRLHNTGKSRKLDRWSKEHDRCIQCGTTETRHAAKGLCGRCDDRRRYWAER